MLAAQLAFLALSSQSSGVPLLSGYWGSSPVLISTALPLGELGCSRLGGCGFWASAERVRPQVGFRLSKIFLQYPVFLRTFCLKFSSNTPFSYVHLRRVGTLLPLLNSAAQLRIQWSLSLLVSIPQFLLGSWTVVTYSLVCRNHVIESG